MVGLRGEGHVRDAVLRRVLELDVARDVALRGRSRAARGSRTTKETGHLAFVALVSRIGTEDGGLVLSCWVARKTWWWTCVDLSAQVQ